MPMPIRLTSAGRPSLAVSWSMIACCMGVPPRPPASTGQVTPTNPASYRVACRAWAAAFPSRRAPSSSRCCSRKARTSARQAASAAVSSKSISVPDQGDRQAVLRERQGVVVHRRHVAGVDTPVELTQQPVHDRLDLQAGEVHPDALVHATAERLPREPVRLVLAALWREPVGVELRRVRPVVLHQVGELDAQRDAGVRGDADALHHGVLDRVADHHRHGCARPEGFGLGAAAVLPGRVLPQVLQHRGGGDGRGVVCGHHQEDHVVDDVVVGEPVALVGLDVAQDGEDVVGLGRPLGRQVVAQEAVEDLAAAVGPAPAGERHVRADDPRGGLDAGDEGLVDPVHLGLAGFLRAAHEQVGGDVQGQLLEPPVRRELLVRGPVRHALLDRRVQPAGVGREARPGEGLLHDPPVSSVPLEVDENEAPVKKGADELCPGGLVGERLVLVLQCLPAGVGAEQHRRGRPADRAEGSDRTVALPVTPVEADRILCVLEDLADERQAAVLAVQCRDRSYGLVLARSSDFGRHWLTSRCCGPAQPYSGRASCQPWRMWHGGDMAVQSGVYRGVSARERAAARRLRLLEAALAVWADPDTRTTMTAVCAEAGLSERYFYESFSGLDALQEELMNEIAAEIEETSRSAADRAGDDPEARVRASVGAVVGPLLADPRKGRVAIVESVALPQLRQRRTELRRHLAHQSAIEAREWLGARGRSETEDETAGLLFIGGMAELVTAWLDGTLRASASEIVDAASRALLGLYR